MICRPPARPALALVLLLAVGACATTPRPDPSPASMSFPVPSDRALRVYRDAIVIDTHNDMPTKMLDDGYDAAVRHPAGFGAAEGHTDLPRLVESGITGTFMSAWIDAPYARKRGDSFARAIKYVDAIRAFADRHPGQLRFATTAADVRAAKRDGRSAILIGLEGGHAIEGSLEGLRELHARGVRYMTLTWNNGNAWAGSSIGVDGTRRGGLTPFGRDVVREMNKLGMIVDLSHVSDSTFFDALAVTTMPAIASHSSARALNDVPRNLSDLQLRAIARNGGVVNVNFFSRFLDPAVQARAAEIEAALARDRLVVRGADSVAQSALLDARRDSLMATLPATPFSLLVDHFVHIARVAGIDHVGVGSDFDGVSALPVGMEDVTALPRLAQALLDRGFSEEDVQKVLGGNMLRVMTQVLDRHSRLP